MIMDASITTNDSPLSWETELETAIDLVDGLLSMTIMNTLRIVLPYDSKNTISTLLRNYSARPKPWIRYGSHYRAHKKPCSIGCMPTTMTINPQKIPCSSTINCGENGTIGLSLTCKPRCAPFCAPYSTPSPTMRR